MDTPNCSSKALFRTASLPPRFSLFDIHVHIGASDTDDIFYPHLSGAEYLEHMSASGITGACVFAPYRANGYCHANEELLSWSTRTHGRIKPFARLGGTHQPIPVPETWLVRRRIESWFRKRARDIKSLDRLSAFAGIKLLPQLDGLPDTDTFEAIKALKLPVLVHGGTHCPPRFIAREILPKIGGPLIIAHCGSFPGDDRAFFDAVKLARVRKNVYLDTSGVPVSEFIRYAAAHVPDKLLFGSDAPLSHPLVAWHQVAATVHDDTLLEKIGGRTARELLNL